MISPVVLGRDILKMFGLGLRKLEAQAVDDILNVEVNDPRDTIFDSLKVNAEVSREVQSSLRELFMSEYIEPVRPNEPESQYGTKTKFDR